LSELPSRASWAIYDSLYFPPLIGTLFEMPDGRRIVQLLIRRRQRSAPDHLFLQLDDTRGHYFSAVFGEIVDNSLDDNKAVSAGVVIGERFRVTSTSRSELNEALIAAYREWFGEPGVKPGTLQQRRCRARQAIFRLLAAVLGPDDLRP
jgi:hypothetical protein